MKRRLFWVAVACVLVLLTALGTLLQALDAAASALSANRPSLRKGATS